MWPIAMTTIAALLHLIPAAFVIGQGSVTQQTPQAAIIPGLVLHNCNWF